MASEALETTLFKNKTLADIFQEIHSNSRKNDERMIGLIEQLKDLIATIGDAQVIAPIIGTYMKLVIDNNEHLIKMATIAQKCVDKGKDNGDSMFTEDDKQQLLLLAQKAEDDIKLPAPQQKQLDKIKK